MSRLITKVNYFMILMILIGMVEMIGAATVRQFASREDRTALYVTSLTPAW